MKKVEKQYYYITFNSDAPFGLMPVKGYIIEIDGVKYGLHHRTKVGNNWSVTHLPTGANVGKHPNKEKAIEIATYNMRRNDAQLIVQSYIDEIKGVKLKLKFPINELT